jgi:acetyltransferase
MTSSYPKELESLETLHNGAMVRLRPIRASDEALLQGLAAHMSAEDMRFRFFAAMRGLSHRLAARLSHIDYDREMALIALAGDGEEALGVARFSADPDRSSAEYAIAVRSDWKGHGLGHLLMARLIEIARRRGIGKLVGQVLPENATMLRLCREFGFTIGFDPNDPKLVRVSKPLQNPVSAEVSAV